MSEPNTTDEPDLKVWEILDHILRELSCTCSNIDPDALREHTYPCQDCDGGCEVCDT
jgi:hypothetical protein